MGLGRLLYATDFEEPKNRLLGSVVSDTEIVFLHTKGEDAAERYCKDWQTRFGSEEVQVSVHSRAGDLVNSILKVVAGDNFSFVVAEFDARMDSNSVVRRLVERLDIPVLIVRRSRDLLEYGDEGVFDRVVFATDWTPVSERAATFLLGLNSLIREMDIVNVIQKRLTVGEMRELKRKLQETRRAFSTRGIDAEFHIYAGRTSEEVTLAARDYNATLIVMGTNRKPYIRSFFSGSSSYKVAEQTEVPTLFIP